MKNKKRLTRNQKIKMNPQGSGNSNYARKCLRRAKAANLLGLPSSTPYPVIWASAPK
jgi:hypothetical protein